MNKRMGWIKKITNVTGVVMIMLGTIPTPVLAQAGSAYAAQETADGVAILDLTLATSYKDLLGPVLACEGDDCTPEEPVEDTDEAPVNVELSPTPTLEPAPEEEPVAEEQAEDRCPNDNNKLEPGICGCGVADVDSDADGTLDCEDECPQDETNTCLDAPAEDPASSENEAEEESSIAEEVTAIADAGLVLVNEDDESVSLASNEAVEIIQSADPYFTSGGNKYCYIHGGETCAGDCFDCIETTTPIQDAIDRAATLLPDDDTIYIEAGAYSGFTIDNFGANLTISAAGEGSTSISGQINLLNNANNITLSNFSIANSGSGSGNTPTINALGNSGTITLQHLTVESDYDSGVWVDDHSGDVMLDDVAVNVDGNDEAVFIDTTLGSGNVQIDDSTFHSDENTGLVVESAGEVKLDNVTSSNNGDWNDSGHGATIDNTSGGADKKVTVLNSIFNNNEGDGLRIFSDGWIYLNNVQANDNEWTGAYLETSGPGVMVLNSEFNDTWSGDWQDLGLEIKHTGGDHETTLCDVVATWNRVKQIKLTSPTGDESSSFLYNFCDVDTGNNTIKIYGGAEWTTLQDPPCPTGQVRGDGSSARPNLTKCYEEDWDREGRVNYGCQSGYEHNGGCYANRSCFLWWCSYSGYLGPQTAECPSGQVQGDGSADRPDNNRCYSQDWDRKGNILFDTHGNITVNEWEADGIWSQKYINLLHPCGEETGGGCCGCCCGGSDYDEECPHCDEVCEIPSSCGDGVEDAGEECDDGNIINGDGCSSTCELEEYCGDQIVNGNEECDGQEHCLPDCTWDEWCGDGIANLSEECDGGDLGAGAPAGAVCNTSCEWEWCGDGIVQDGLNEICDPGDPVQDYCNDQCDYKEFADLDLDPHCSGVGAIAWSVINPNAFSVPNVQVIVDGAVRYDGTLPAATEVSMGTTPDGPLTHYMQVTWPGGAGTVRTSRICEPTFVPAALPIPVTGEELIIPVTGADILGTLANQQRLLVTGGAALLGLSIMIGGRKKKK